jgi:hypothetical protein
VPLTRQKSDKSDKSDRINNKRDLDDLKDFFASKASPFGMPSGKISREATKKQQQSNNKQKTK